MRFDGPEMRKGICMLCGKKIGVGHNHAKCSREKQKKFAEQHTSKASKKINQRMEDYLTKLAKEH